MGVIVVVCAPFGLAMLEAKTEIMCLRTKRTPGPRRHIQRRGGRSGVQPDERICIPPGKRQSQSDLFIKVDRRIRSAWCNFQKYTLKLYDRLSAPLELKIRMLRAEVLETMLYGCVTWSPRGCHYVTVRRVHRSFLTRCIGRRKNNRNDHLISYLNTLFMNTGSCESIDVIMRRRRWILFEGFVARMEDTRLPKCVMFGELVGGRATRGEGKRVDGVSPGRLQSFRYPRQPVDDCSPERGEMVQDGVIRSGMFHGEMQRCRKS